MIFDWGHTHSVREAFRRLWRNRTVTLLVALSLAIGIGANTAIFTIVDAVFLAPLPVKQHERIYAVFTTDPRNPGYLAASYPNYTDLLERTSTFEQLVAATGSRVNLAAEGRVHELSSELVTPNYFTMAQVVPELGGVFTHEPASDKVRVPPVVLSHATWKKHFRADREVVGRLVQINNTPFQVLGVMPDSFRGFERIGSTDLWLPMESYRSVIERPDWLQSRRALMFYLIGRLKNGVTREAAAADFDRAGRQLAAAYPHENAGRTYALLPMDEASLGPARRPMLVRAATVLMSAATLVLLIAIANVGSVLLSRATVRRREMAVRMAMGATPRKLLAHVVTESGLLVLFGGSLGLLLGVLGRKLLWQFRPDGMGSEDLVLGLNGRILAFAFLLSLVTGVMASVLPAMQSLGGDLTGELRERVQKRLPGWRCLRLREVLVAGQVALSLMALVGAHLFLQSLRNAQAIDPGFDTRNIATFEVNPRRLGLHGKERLGFYIELQKKVAGVSGVQSVSVSSNPLLGHDTLRRTVRFEKDGEVSKGGKFVRVNMVSERYFETTDVLVLRGRDFQSGDRYEAPLVAIVNETMARQFWPDTSPIGKRFRFFGDMQDHTVVGVARDSVYSSIGERPEPCAFVPLLQNSPPMASVLLRTNGDPGKLSAGIEAVLRAARPDLPQVEVTPIQTSVDRALWAPRMAAVLLAVFGLISLALASVGVYGVTAHMVSRRTGEMGVRMAMGACPVDVLELILRQCLTLILPGLAIGAVAAFVLARFVFQDMLFGVRDTDLEPYLAASLLLAAVALLASYLPARRATGLHPVMALREQ